MTPFEWIGIIIALVGMTAGLCSWAYAVFLTKTEAKLQEKALDQLISFHKESTNIALGNVEHSLVEVKSGLRELVKKVDERLERRTG